MGYIYTFDSKACWYNQVCSLYEGKDCTHACPRYMEMDYLMYHSGIPKVRQYKVKLIPPKPDVDAFLSLQDIAVDIEEFVKNGESVYIRSQNFGNGKTTWAIKLMQTYFDTVWAGNGFRCRGIFVHVPTLLTKIKENISRKDDTFELMRSRLGEVDLVIWDDIASTNLTPFDHSNLLAYIDQRKLNNLSNIYTGNLDKAEIQTALGNRLASRVWNDSTLVEFIGKDRRGI